MNISIYTKLLSEEFQDRLLYYALCSLFLFLPIAMSPANISGGIVLLIWFISSLRQNFWGFKKWILPVFILIAIPWLSLLYTNNLENGIDFALKSYYWLYAFAIASISFKIYKLETLFKYYIAGCIFSSFVSWLQYIELIPLKHNMPIAFFYWHITYSLLLAFGCLVSLFFIYKSQCMKKRIIYIIFFLIIFSALAIVPGRVGHLVFFIFVPFAIYKLSLQNNILKIILSYSVIVGILFLSPVVRDRISQVITDIEQYNQGNVNTSIGNRFHLWKVSFSIIKENPLLGIGTGSFVDEIKKHKPDPAMPDFVQPHNNILYLAVSFGIIGVIGYLWLLVILFRSSWKKFNKIEGFSIFSFSFIMLIGGMFDSQIIINGTGILFALFTGLLDALDA